MKRILALTAVVMFAVGSAPASAQLPGKLGKALGKANEAADDAKKLKDTVVAIRLGQPRPGGTELYMFTVPAEKLLKMCVVLRKAEGSAYSYQRILHKKRLPKVGEFVRTAKAVLPTNIVVHLGESVAIDEIETNRLVDDKGRKVETSRPDHQLVTLTFPLKYGLMELIDGQHRLFGFIHADDTIRRDFNLVVLGLRNLDSKQRSDTFVAINDNARRVDANLVARLRFTTDEKVCKRHPDLMAIKIVMALNEMSPFKDAIKVLDVGDQRLTLKGLSGYDLVGLVGPNGLLRKQYPKNTSKKYISVLRSYFSVIRAEFPKEWIDPNTYITATNRGVSAFLKLLRSILKSEQKRATKRVTTKYIKALQLNWSGTWETAKLKASYVGSQGWKNFHRDMVKAIQKKYKTFVE
jgi:DGQHR domain-containing protein